MFYSFHFTTHGKYTLHPLSAVTVVLPQTAFLKKAGLDLIESKEFIEGHGVTVHDNEVARPGRRPGPADVIFPRKSCRVAGLSVV
jgi:hypothetical protein